MMRAHPEPAFAQPLSTEHTHTIILLHDIETDGKAFGKEFLASTDLRKRLPTVKFVFPTSRKRRPLRLARPTFRQWFVECSTFDPDRKAGIRTEGLFESADRIREIVTEEAKLLGENGYERIILGGFGQGCVVGICTVLGGFHGFEDTEFKEPMKVGAFFGLSGWLPFGDKLSEIWEGRSIETKLWDHHDRNHGPRGRGGYRRGRGGRDRPTRHNDDNFRIPSAFSDDSSELSKSNEDPDVCMYSDSESKSLPTPRQFNFEYLSPFQSNRKKWSKRREATNFIRDILGLAVLNDDDKETDDPARFLPHLQTPVFLGHGVEDDCVSVGLGERMSKSLMEEFKVPVTWKTYEGLSHSYRPEDEIQDVLAFLNEHLALQSGESSHQDMQS